MDHTSLRQAAKCDCLLLLGMAWKTSLAIDWRVLLARPWTTFGNENMIRVGLVMCKFMSIDFQLNRLKWAIIYCTSRVSSCANRFRTICGRNKYIVRAFGGHHDRYRKWTIFIIMLLLGTEFSMLFGSFLSQSSWNRLPNLGIYFRILEFWAWTYGCTDNREYLLQHRALRRSVGAQIV